MILSGRIEAAYAARWGYRTGFRAAPGFFATSGRRTFLRAILLAPDQPAACQLDNNVGNALHLVQVVGDDHKRTPTFQLQQQRLYHPGGFRVH